MSTKPGFGIIEIVVAIGLFAVIGLTGITMVLHSFTTNRLGDEQTTASNLSSAGVEVARALRKQNWANLASGTYGLKNTAGLWSFTATPETWGKFTRTITIEDGQRNISGNIVDSGGTVDANLKKITSTTTWNVGGNRNNSVVATSYLTNFAKTITSSGDFILAWGDTTTTPKWNYYTNTTNLFGSNTNLVAGESAQNVVTKTSPTKSEVLVGYTSSGGTLHLLCYNGTSWSEDWSVSVGGTGTTRRFDIGFEEATGDAMVVYSTNTTTNNELAYRTKSGSSDCGSPSWSTATNLTAGQTNDIVQWVKLAEDERSSQNILAIAWEDATSAISSSLWNGTAWGNEPSSAHDSSLERATTAGDTAPFDLTFEGITGSLMVVWGRNTTTANANGAFYRRCTGGTPTCTWGGATAIFAGTADDATNLDISSNHLSNEIVFASIGNQQNDLQGAYWNGSTWTTSANLDTSSTTPIAGSQKVATGWVKSGATTRNLIVYDDQGTGTINWIAGNGAVFSSATRSSIAPTFANNQGTYAIYMDPRNSDRLLFVVSDPSNDLFVKRLVIDAVPNFTWTDSNAAAALETNLSGNTANPFSGAYWRN